MSNEPPPENSPNETLAALVVERLVQKGQVAAGKADEITKKLISGTASREDWALWVELAQAKRQKDGSNGKD